MSRFAGLFLWLAGALVAQDSSGFGIFEGASDVGKPSQKGSVTYDAARKEYRVTGGGNNIWANRDDFYFVWKKLQGDAVLTATLKIESAGVAHRKAGLMIRRDLETGAPYADIMVHGDGLTGLQYREKADDITRGVRFPISGPTRIRIERRRYAITVWAGKEGAPFQALGATDVNIGNPVYVGLAVCPHDDKASLTAVFSDVTLEIPPASPGVMPAQNKAGQKGQGPPTPGRPAVKSFITVYDVADGSKKVVHTADGFYQAPNWSPDGKYLLLNSPGRLWRLPLAGPKLEPVDTGDVRGINNDHGITADGKWFAISAGQMFVLPSTGGQPRQVTKNVPSYFHGFSPDGKWLTYCAKRGDNFDIYRIPFGGGEEERLTTHPGYDDGPEYSPDGRWIYFNSNRSGSWDIWRMPVAGAGAGDAKAERITSDELEDWFPHVSPDGKTMVFLSFEKGIPDHPPNKNVVLRMMPAPGAKAGRPKIKEIVKLFGGQGTINVNSWSPDSKKFAYVSYELLSN